MCKKWSKDENATFINILSKVSSEDQTPSRFYIPEQEEMRAQDLKQIQEATVHLDKAQDKVALYTLFQHDKQRAMGTQKILAELDLGKYPSQHKSQLEAGKEIMKFIARTGNIFEKSSHFW